MDLCLLNKIKAVLKNTIVKNNLLAERYNMFVKYLEDSDEYRERFLALLNQNIDYSLGYDESRIFFFHQNEIIYQYEFYFDDLGNIIGVGFTDNSDLTKEKKLTRS